MSRPPAGSGGDAGNVAMISVIVAQIVLPILAGVWLDNRNGWSPWGAVSGTVLGFASVVWTARKLNRQETRTETRNGGKPPADT